jgi:hypothetical protein
MLDCVQCSSIVFNIHYVHILVFSFSLSLCTYVHIFHSTVSLYMFFGGTGRGGKGVEERGVAGGGV